MKSISVTVHAKGKDKGNVGAYTIPYQFITYMPYAATETEKLPEQATELPFHNKS